MKPEQEWWRLAEEERLEEEAGRRVADGRRRLVLVEVEARLPELSLQHHEDPRPPEEQQGEEHHHLEVLHLRHHQEEQEVWECRNLETDSVQELQDFIHSCDGY